MPAIPSLPRRCPAEGMIAQAVVGINGVTAGQYGSLAVDPAAVDPYAPVITDIATDSFPGLRRFLDHAVGGRPRRSGEVAVRRTGDARRGAHPRRAGRRRGVRRRGSCGPLARRVVVGRRSPRRCPDLAADRSSSTSRGSASCSSPASRSLPTRRSTCCRGRWPACRASPRSACTAAPTPTWRRCSPPDPTCCRSRRGRRWPALPATSARFLDGGGRVAWGVVPTDGPMFVVGRSPLARACASCGRSSSERGVDADLLRAAQPRHGALRSRAAHPGGRRAGVPRRARGRPPDRRLVVR